MVKIKKFNEEFELDFDINEVKDIIKSLWGESLGIKRFVGNYYQFKFFLFFYLENQINNENCSDYLEFLDIIKKTKFVINNSEFGKFRVDILIDENFSNELETIYNAKRFNL